MNRALAFRSDGKPDNAAKDFIEFLKFVNPNSRSALQIKVWLKKNHYISG
jgi:hypothetical protein